MKPAPTLVAVILAVAVGMTAGIAVYNKREAPQAAFIATDITDAPWAREFDLLDHNGQRRTLADFRGKVVLLFLGYTNCPDACPTALAEMAQVVQRLGPDGTRVQGLFVTTDPARDTSERLATYVTAFHPSFLGLRGTPDQIAHVAKEFKAYFRTDVPKADAHAAHAHHEPANYTVDHSTGILAFDPTGRVRLYIGATNRSVDAMVHDIKLLLQS